MYSSVEHNQPSSILVKPGESVTISCKISGYALSDGSKAPSWIRHTQENKLEFIGMIHAGGRIDYKDSLKNKFTISRDTSTSTVYLKGQNLQTEDTAVYYCVRYTGTVINTSLVLVQKPCAQTFWSYLNIHDYTLDWRCLIALTHQHFKECIHILMKAHE